LQVKLQDGRQFDADVIGRDPATDLAVLHISATGLTTAKLGDSDRLDVGEWVVAIGSPFGFESSVTAGIISAKGRRGLSRDSTERYEEFLQTDAAINPGNSGGPLVNLDGDVIGINTQIASTAGGSVGIGFAIPSNMARSVMEMIIQHGRTERGWLGVAMEDVTPELATSLKLPTRSGVIVREIVEKSPAARAGLRTGDVIVSINDKAVTDSNRLRNLIAFTSPGERMKLTVLRGGQRVEVVAEIVDQTSGRAMDSGGLVLREVGLVVRSVDGAIARRLGYSADLHGAVVLEVIEGGKGEEAGLVPGDVIMSANGDEVRSAEDVARVVGAISRNANVSVEFARAGRKWATEIKGR
jgi:S1-C subfamily serine protease